MKFEIREKVRHFKDNVSFQTLSTVEMHPIVNVYDSRDKVDINGHLIVSGEFSQPNVQENWEEQYEQSDGIHYGEMFSKDELEKGQQEVFQYKIPLSIQIQQNRVIDMDQIFVVVDHFDYDVLSDEEIEVVAHVKVLGIHPDMKQEIPVEFSSYDDEDFPESQDYPDYGDNSYQQTNDDSIDAIESQESIENHESSSSSIETIEPVEAIEPIEAMESVENVEEEKTQKMKIGFKGKPREESKEAIGGNPLYSLLKKEKVQPEKTEAPVQEVLSKEESLAEINDNLDENQLGNENKQVNEKVIEDIGPSKKMLFSLLKGNEEKRAKVKMIIVQKEDTLEFLAKKYQVKEYDLIQYNRLENGQVNAGQILYIPLKA